MSKLLLSAALSATVASLAVVASPASAQAVAPAKVAVVDVERIMQECNACKTALGSLQQQIQTFNARAAQLQTQLRPEGQYLEGAVKALNGKAPDAALATRIGTFQQNQQNAGQELQAQQAQMQRNQSYYRDQVLSKLQPLYSGAMTKRGANVLVDIGTTLAYDPQLDVTNDLMATLNTTLTTVQTVAPAQQQQAPAAARPAPSGR